MEKLQNAELISNEQHLNIELKISTALQWQETWARERGAQSASLDLAISPLPQILAVDFRRPNARSDRLDTASIRERTQEVHQVVGPSNASEDARIFLTSLIGLTIVLLRLVSNPNADLKALTNLFIQLRKTRFDEPYRSVRAITCFISHTISSERQGVLFLGRAS